MKPLNNAYSNCSPPEVADFYFDKAGLMVFTAQYLRKKGACCGNGCRHCPFEYEEVPEPHRSILIEQQKDHHT